MIVFQPPEVSSIGTDPRLLINAGPSPYGWSGVENFIRCPQLWAYDKMARDGTLHAIGDAPAYKTPHYLIRGSLFHVASAHYYARRAGTACGLTQAQLDLLYEPLQAIDVAAMGFAGENAPGVIDEARDTAVAMWKEYAALWGDESWFDVLSVEALVVAPVNGFPFSTRLDLVVQTKRGDVFIWDHKTMQTPSAFRYTLAGGVLSKQLLGEAWCAERGLRFGGVVINAVGSREPYGFKRIPVDPAPWRVQRWADDVTDGRKRMLALLDEGRSLWKYPGADSEQTCQGTYEHPCRYFELCRWGPPGGAT